MLKILGSIFVALGLATAAHAALQPVPVSAPEIDPASALGAVTLLGGGLLVLRGRFKKK